jgi:hypothetical protein
MAVRVSQAFGFLLTCLLFLLVPFTHSADARSLPKMREVLQQTCSESAASFDIFAPPESGNFPVVVTFGLSRESQITGEPEITRKKKVKSKSKSKVKPKSKSSHSWKSKAKAIKVKSVSKPKKRKKSSQSRKQTTMPKAVEMFFTLQGYIVLNLRSQHMLNPAALAQDVACALTKAKELGGNPEQAFVIARGAGASQVLALATEPSRSQALPGLLGIVSIEPNGLVRLGSADAEQFVPSFIVGLGSSEAQVGELPAAQKLRQAGVPLRIAFAHKKKRGDLASELGMATDVVTRDVMDFMRQRLKEVNQSGQVDSLTTATPVPSTGSPSVVATPDDSVEEP